MNPLVEEEKQSFLELYHTCGMLKACREFNRSVSVVLPNKTVIQLKKFLGYQDEPLIAIKVNGKTPSHFSRDSLWEDLAHLLSSSQEPLFSHLFQMETIKQLGNPLQVCTLHTGSGTPHRFVLGVSGNKTLAMALRGLIQGAESHV